MRSNRWWQWYGAFSSSSNSAYALPKILQNKKTFALAETDEAKFIEKRYHNGKELFIVSYIGRKSPLMCVHKNSCFREHFSKALLTVVKILKIL